ncbi:hypothetical protein EVAR_55395_1 [Eumeta japonica]|uniref:Uncharacterized protein n=1 Tax=Eumeta variegata TaxID=151549 RepID=A0A4C1YMR5_EUMVA|nr:hypothetical protein EVAR_55395_1 [Eumeta japonica]
MRGRRRQGRGVLNLRIASLVGNSERQSFDGRCHCKNSQLIGLKRVTHTHTHPHMRTHTADGRYRPMANGEYSAPALRSDRVVHK